MCGTHIGLCLPRSSVAISVGEPAEDRAFGVDHVPLARDLGGFRAVCTHGQDLESESGRAREDSSAEPETIAVRARFRQPGRTLRTHGSDGTDPAPTRSPTPTGPRPKRRSRCSSTVRSIPSSTWCAPPATAPTRPSPTTASVTFRRNADGSYERIAVTGRDPLADQSTAKFTPLADERAHPYPHRSENAYPHAFDQIAQLFDAPAAPDLCVLHSAAHNWEDQGGHLGEHGSLGLVQARAPFVLGGQGRAQARARARSGPPRRRRADDLRAPRLRAPATTTTTATGSSRCRTATPLDRPARPERAAALRRRLPVRRHQRQRALRHGRAGEAPNVARLIEMGAALGHGAMASLPTVTLANHTSIITGAHPATTASCTTRGTTAPRASR